MKRIFFGVFFGALFLGIQLIVQLELDIGSDIGLGMGLDIGLNPGYAQMCTDPKDTYDDYDQDTSGKTPNNIPSEYYVLSYSWAPDYCRETAKEKDKKPGEKDYLQCKDGGHAFNYILHGLWPQGKLNGKGGYPKYCGQDPEKISRDILDEFLCMTPSVYLLQHEFEKHGTCMHDKTLRTPQNYFETAMALHSKLTLPDKKLAYTKENIQWFVHNNGELKLTPESIQYYEDGQEWQICYDNNFELMCCPKNCLSDNGGAHDHDQDQDQAQAQDGSDENCMVKGNISSSGGKKYYFLSTHPNYAKVVIVASEGERCFETEEEAINAGWTKAPN